MKKLSNLDEFKKFISISLFGRRKALKYIFFDKIYSKLILNKKKLPDFLKKFDEDGYAKIVPNFKEELDDLVNNLEIENKNKTNPPYFFKVDQNIKDKITNIQKKIDKQYLTYLKKYFNSDILPAYICLRKNTYYKKEHLDQELFNNNFHNDGYLFTHFKIFINLNDISEKNGPMKIVPKMETKKFLKLINYNDRKNYSDENDNISYANIGQKGDCLLFDPTNCFHKAGMPQESYERDYLIITYVCLPTKKSLIDQMSKIDIYKYENNDLLDLSKPTRLIQTIKLLFSFYCEKTY